MEKLTYTHDAQAAAVIASVYQDAPPLAYVHSFGCQQNVNDGEKIRGVLMDVGFGMCDNVDAIMRNSKLLYHVLRIRRAERHIIERPRVRRRRRT